MNRTLIVRCGLFSFFASALLQTAEHAQPFTTAAGHYYIIDDDVMISLRVARNIAHGLGPYFNPGERIAATTSLFWPYILSPAYYWLTLPHAVLFVSLFSLSITLGILGLLALAATDAASCAITSALMVALPPFHVYAGSACENIPEAFFVTAGFLVLLGRLGVPERWRTCAALASFSIAFLLRPDAAPIIAVVVLLALWQAYGCRGVRPLLGVSAVATAVLAYIGLELHFYGNVFPNTYYLKVNPGLHSIAVGCAYLLRTIWEAGPPIAVAFLAMHAVRSYRGLSPSYKTVNAALLAQCAYIVYVGGDAFSFGRFFLIVMPTALLLSVELILSWLRDQGALDNWQAVSTAVVILVVPLAIGTFVTDSTTNDSGPVYGLVTSAVNRDPQMSEIALGELIRRAVRPNDGEIGVFWAGALSYYMPEYRFSDFLGKADLVIATEPVKWGPPGHNKWDIRHILLDRRPVAIPFLKIPETQAKMMLSQHQNFAFVAALQTNPITAQRYTYLSPQALGQNYAMGLLVRDDMVSRFTGDTPNPGQ